MSGASKPERLSVQPPRAGEGAPPLRALLAERALANVGESLEPVPERGALLPLWSAGPAPDRPLPDERGLDDEERFALFWLSEASRAQDACPRASTAPARAARARLALPRASASELTASWAKAGVERAGLGFSESFARASAPRDAGRGVRSETRVALEPGLFVYGSLLAGEKLHASIAEGGGARDTQPARCRGLLYDLGDYPGLVFEPPDAGQEDALVEGEWLRARDLPRLLGLLDELEDFAGFGASGSLYVRTLAWACLGPSSNRDRRWSKGGALRLAWVYLLARRPEGAPLVAGGSWRAWRRERGR